MSKRKSLYPTRLRKGDKIEANNWSAEWDGECVVGSCGFRYTRAELAARAVGIADCKIRSCTACLQACIIEQLIAEDAL